MIIADFHTVRVLSSKMNSTRPAENFVTAGQINAMGLIDEVYHALLRLYEDAVNPEVFSRALNSLSVKIGETELVSTLEKFLELYPPIDVYTGRVTIREYLQKKIGNKTNLEITLEEMILVHFANVNPANNKLVELFDDKSLALFSNYSAVISELETFFENEKTFGPDDQFIFNFLRAPFINHPESLSEQLMFIKNRWGMLLDPKFLEKILSGLDLIKEDAKIFAGFGPGATFVPTFDKMQLLGFGDKFSYDDYTKYLVQLEAERFTHDIDWMPRVVLLAKNIYVWLDQLSKEYNRSIQKLDQIPDEELDQLARWNFTGLWLIGIWERSSASQKIKQIMGNPEALSSAYSLYDYQIANDLGGEDAFQNLNYRCMIREIRLASDMVPNHMGIFSKWIVEHPEYFIQSSQCPFPNYSFTGVDLSNDPSIQIKIEDGYWSRRDAAVIFQRIDNRNGEIRYIYHGNDGTSMPWNDTAQLNLLRLDVRESLIQLILHVARKFSIIRFDAAMTLTQKHYQRLWFPLPGTGGDIPSRAGSSLTNDEFYRLYPKEFWREVVDRINQELPNTLLLAEAFWLLEGYFVRTLGMHRVYNSAFMNMLKNEDNEKYRDLITNTLEFNPEILKRYVNFMSNPDEETAIKQFSDGDKYFGVTVLMVTLPGLPMFGHGQIEGYHEKYGMEYRKAYYNESPNEDLVRRHSEEIFPLMGKRYLFSQVENFEFYDFHDSNGSIIESVFTYSNRSGDERALIIYNNSYQTFWGSINYSTGKNKGSSEGERNIVSQSLASALNMNNSDKHFYIYRDHRTKLEYIRSGKDFYDYGLSLEVRGYQYYVFIDFFEVYDFTGEFSQLSKLLNGAGVSSIQQELINLRFGSVHKKLKEILSKTFFDSCGNYCFRNKDLNVISLFSNENLERMHSFVDEINFKIGWNLQVKSIKDIFAKDLILLKNLNEYFQNRLNKKSKPKWYKEGVKSVKFFEVDASKSSAARNRRFLFTLFFIDALLKSKSSSLEQRITAFNELKLENVLIEIIEKFGFGHEESKLRSMLFRLILFSIEGDSLDEPERVSSKNILFTLAELLKSEEAQLYIGLNDYQGEKYFVKERLEELVDWIYTILVIKTYSQIVFSLSEQEEVGISLEKSFAKSITLKKVKSFEKALKILYEDSICIKESALKANFKFNLFIEDLAKVGSTGY